MVLWLMMPHRMHVNAFIVLALSLATTTGWSAPQTYREGLYLFCHAPTLSGAAKKGTAREAERMVSLAKWITAKLRNQQVTEYLNAMANASSARRARSLQKEAKRLRIKRCPMVDIMLGRRSITESEPVKKKPAKRKRCRKPKRSGPPLERARIGAMRPQTTGADGRDVMLIFNNWTKSDVYSCFNRYLPRRFRKTQGSATLQFKIAPGGAVTSAKVLKMSYSRVPGLSCCLRKRARSWHWPMVKRETVSFTVRFVYNARENRD